MKFSEKKRSLSKNGMKMIAIKLFATEGTNEKNAAGLSELYCVLGLIVFSEYTEVYE